MGRGIFSFRCWGNVSYVYDDDLLLTQANGYTVSRNAQHGLPETIADTSYQQQRSYNAYGEPQNVTTQIANNAAYSYTLTYNDLGLIVGKSEALHDGSTHQYVYTYDDNRRLKSVMKDSVLTEAYSYDHNGNRTAQTNTARGIAAQTASYNIADQLTQDGNVTYQYDADGYLTRKTDGSDITHYQYSRQGRLLSVQTPTELIEYRHNALGNRVAKIVNGQTTEKYLWLDKTTLLATYDGNNNLKQRFEYTLGHTPTSFTQNGNRYYIASDHLGSPRAISDASGNIVKAVSYDSYGNVLSDSNLGIAIPFGFAGGLQDSDTGLIRFGFRDYDPQTGRWTARDLIGLSGGRNLYAYAYNDPILWVDLFGLWPEFIDKAKKSRQKNTVDLHRDQHPGAHRDIFGPKKHGKSNTVANKQFKDAANRAGIPKDKQKGFSDWIHKEKKLDGMGGDDNYSWDTLLEKAEEYKYIFCK